MKKIVLISLAVLMVLSVNVFADKEVTLNKMAFVSGNIQFNCKSSDDGGYYPASISFSGKAMGDSTLKNISNVVYLGTARETKYTPRELYIKTKAALGQEVADTLKQLYIDGINEDISQQ